MSGQIQETNTNTKYQGMAILQSLCFFMIFAAFNAAQSLVGALPGPAGIGAASFAALYGTYTLLCIPAPKVVESLGPKLAMVLGAIPYVALVFSFLAPEMCTDDITEHCWSSSTLVVLKITMGALVGVGAPLLWTGQGIYLARAAAWSALQGVDTSFGVSSIESGSADPYAKATTGAPLLGSIGLKERTGEANKKFNGIFFSIFQLSGCRGLVVPSIILWLVEGTNAFTYLFLGLGICCATGLVVMTTCLPSLGPVPKDDEETMRLSNDDGSDEGVTVFATLTMCFSEPRMYLLVPNIVYNGMSLGFIWFSYNTFAWGSGLGASFIGFGSASFYLINSLSTQVTGKMAVKTGQMGVMSMAIIMHALFWIFFMFYGMEEIQCEPKGCMTGTAGSCIPANFTFDAVECTASKGLGSNCAVCEPYTLSQNQTCGAGLIQCEWLHGNIAPPSAMSVLVLFFGAFVFAIGDSVWEGQVPAVLQTLHDSASGRQESAMANLKLWQSLGISIFYGLSYVTQDIKLEASILLVTLVVSSLFLMIAHFRVASFDTGKKIGEGQYSDLS